jgi:hypothetical protein
MTWAVVAIVAVTVCVAAWLYRLLRQRSSNRTAAQGNICKVRIVEGREPGLHHRFPHYVQEATWDDGVLLVHGSVPLVTRTSALQVTGLATRPHPTWQSIRGMDDPTIFRLRLDSGAVVELATTGSHLPGLLGRFASSEPLRPIRQHS